MPRRRSRALRMDGEGEVAASGGILRLYRMADRHRQEQLFGVAVWHHPTVEVIAHFQPCPTSMVAATTWADNRSRLRGPTSGRARVDNDRRTNVGFKRTFNRIVRAVARSEGLRGSADGRSPTGTIRSINARARARWPRSAKSFRCRRCAVRQPPRRASWMPPRRCSWSTASRRRACARSPRRPRVNLAAVNYHFGSKEELFQAVLTRRLDPMNQARVELLDKLEARRRRAAAVVRADPDGAAHACADAGARSAARRQELSEAAGPRLRRPRAVHPAVPVRAVRADDRALQGGVRPRAAAAAAQGAVVAPALHHGRAFLHPRGHRRAQADRRAESRSRPTTTRSCCAGSRRSCWPGSRRRSRIFPT